VAAVNWSLLFSPAFGAYLQMKNWEALGERAKAEDARAWFQATLLFGTAYPVLEWFCATYVPANLYVLRPLWLLFVIFWYFASAAGQIRYIKERNGGAYVRRPWAKVLSVATAGAIAYSLATFLVLAFLVLVWPATSQVA
jgi:hypothetical protein